MPKKETAMVKSRERRFITQHLGRGEVKTQPILHPFWGINKSFSFNVAKN
jgi:hypothetical protein